MVRIYVRTVAVDNAISPRSENAFFLLVVIHKRGKVI
jgi:hypothetical protein